MKDKKRLIYRGAIFLLPNRNSTIIQSYCYVISNYINSSLRRTNSTAPTVLIDLRNTLETNYLVLSMTHGNKTGSALLMFGETSEMSEEKGGCNHRTPRGDGVRKRDLGSQWLSVVSPFSPATIPPSGGITFFVILVTCISLLIHPPPDWIFSISLSLSFSCSHAGKISIPHSQINTSLIPSSEYRDRE